MASSAGAASAQSSGKVRLKLPPGHEEGFRWSLENYSHFAVDDLADDWVAVERAETDPVPRLFVAHRLADAGTDLSDAALWQPVFEDPPYPSKPKVTLPPDMQKYFDELQQKTDLKPVLERIGATAAQLQADEMPELFQRELPGLFKRFPQGSFWYVSVDDVLLKRLGFMRVRLQLEFTPDVDYDPNTRDAVRYFGLHTSTGGVSFDKALDHALLAIPPVAHGITFGVYPHAFVFLFADFIDLRRHQDQSFGHFYYPSVARGGAVPGIKFPVKHLPPAHLESLLQWWTRRLDVVYGYAADPTNFSDGGLHDVAAQAAWFFTLERMMADVTVLLAAVDAPQLLRMQAAFDLLDKADSLLVPRGKDAEGKYFKRLLRRSEALPRIRRAFESLPVQLRSRFIEWADTAYDRLYSDIEQGTMAARRTERGVKVALTDPGKPQLMPWDDYIPALMRTARNSSHGLQRILRAPDPSKAGKPDPRLLIATSDGEVPYSFHEVATVAFLGLMADAERLCDGTWWDP